MAVRHGKFGQLSVNSVDLTSFIVSMEQNITPETADTTVMGSTWRTHIAGLLGSGMSVECLYDPTPTTGIASAIWACITGLAPVAVVYKPGGTASGQRTYSFNALVSGGGSAATLDGAATFTFELLATGAVTPTTQ